MHGMQSVLGHLGHPSQLKLMFVICIELVEIICHQRTMTYDFFLRSIEQNEVLFATLMETVHHFTTT